MIRLVILMSAAMLSAADDLDVITVPRDVLKFIIGCNQGDPASAYSVPVHKTQISDIDGTTSQHVSLLSLDELRDALKQSVHNEDVLGHIIKQVEDAAKTDKLSLSRSDCAVENHISIAVPPQELDDFNDRVQMLMQQNTRILLEQINNLFTYKLIRQKFDAEKLFKRRTNQILQKLNKIMTHLGIPLETNEEGEDEDDDELSILTTPVYPIGDYDTTWHPEPVETEPVSEAVPGPQDEPEPEPESEPEPEPQTEQDTTVRPLPSASPAPVSEAATEMFQPVTVTELLQPMTTNKPGSSEEDGDDDDDDDDDKQRLSGSSSSVGTQDSGFIRTPQQPPIVFNNGIGLIPSISRQRQRINQKTRVPSGTIFRPIFA